MSIRSRGSRPSREGPKDKNRLETIARRYFVWGRVQGVGYRVFVQRAANLLGVSGYVRNLEDGRVEVFATGSKAQLDELTGLLWKGPRWSEGSGVEETEAPPQNVPGSPMVH